MKGARGLWEANTVIRRTDCRYYAGIRFTDTVDGNASVIEDALRSTVVQEENGEERVNPETVTVGPQHALVTFEHHPEDRHIPGHVAGRFYHRLGEWGRRNGYITDDLRLGYESGTIPSNNLPHDADTDRLTERLGLDAEDVDAPPQNHYTFAAPERSITATEREYLTAAVARTEDTARVTPNGALVVLNHSRPRWNFSVCGEIRRTLDRLMPSETDLANRSMWEYEHGTFGWGTEEARQAVVHRADSLAATQDDENATSEGVP